MAVALCAAACVTTAAFAEDDLVSSANTTVIAEPVNPKPGMVFKGYNLDCYYSYSKEFQSLKATLASAAPVKSTVVTSEQFTYKAFQDGARIQQGVWEGFLKCKRKAQCTFLMKMRGGTKTQKETSHYKLGKYTLDADHATLRNDDTNEAQTITQREAQILQLLAENKNNVVRREAILSRFWNTEDDYFASRSLDVFVNKLRKLLADEPKVELKTVRGVGLQLIVK